MDNVQLGESVILSPLRITNIIHQENEDEKSVEIVWNSRPGRVYAVYASENLSDWDELDDNVSSEGEETTFIDEGLSNNKRKVFYKVEDITN